MRYLGSKVSVLENIYQLVSQRVSEGTFCDPFGGIGTVGSFFKSKGYKVYTGDILTSAYYFQIARVHFNRKPFFTRLKNNLGFSSSATISQILNDTKSKNGWVTKQFSEKRQFFTKENAQHIDGCRLLISQWSNNELISNNERAILLASLINSMDKVANTAGTYYAYLKTWYRKAVKPFSFEMIPFTKGNSDSCCFLGEAKQLISQRFYNVLYLDPPYNERNYSSYYHLPESVALGKTPRTNGLSGISNTHKKWSDFNNARKASNALEEIMENAKFNLLVFHYSDNGLIPPNKVRSILNQYGNVEEAVISSKGYTTEQTSRTIKHRLYLITNG